MIGAEFLHRYAADISYKDGCVTLYTEDITPVQQANDALKTQTERGSEPRAQMPMNYGTLPITTGLGEITIENKLSANETVYFNKEEDPMMYREEDLDSNLDYDLVEYRSIKKIQGPQRNTELIEMLKLHEKGEEVQQIIKQHNDVFFLEGDTFTSTDAAVHKIETTSEVPIHKRQYRFAEVTKKQVIEQIDEMLAQGIVKHSISPWNAPVLCIRKKLGADGEQRYRIVVDYRELNLITKSFVYPIPLIPEILDTLGDSKYFSTLDLKSGFYQVPLHPDDAPKTAFSTPIGHYEYTRMPMGLKNSPSTFQRLMNTVLYEIPDVRAVVYLDDIVVYGRTIAEHNEHLEKVLKGLRKHNLRLEPKKCQLLCEEIQYLGHHIDKHGVKPLMESVSKIAALKPPTTVRQVRSVLGTVNFYAKFIPGVAKMRKPLNDLLKKGVKFHWSPECQAAFDDLKAALVSEPLLVRPNYADTFVLTTDASNYAIGAVLSNEKTMNRPIAFASRALIDAEERYHTIEKELLAIVWAAKYFRHYVYGQRFIVYTDHRPLVSIWHLKETSPTLTRLRLKLQGFECDIRYKQGSENVVADFLSRIPASDMKKEVTEELEGAPVMVVMTRRQKMKLQEASERAKSGESPPAPDPRRPDDIDPHTAELMDLPLEEDFSADVMFSNELYEQFEQARTESAIELSKIRFVRKMENDPSRYRIVILNSRSIHTEISKIWTPPHGLKDYTSQGVVHVPEAKILGVILEGKSNSLINSALFFERFHQCLSKLAEMTDTDQEIPILSFRRIKQFDIFEMVQFLGEEHGFAFSLYNTAFERIVVQQHELPTLLREFHDSPLGGHVGAKRMRKKLAALYHWKNMRRDIEDYVRKCESCQKNKICKYNRIPMKITTTASEPFEKIFMDIVVLPETARGNRYGLVVQDDLTRFLIVAAMENQEAVTVAQTFVENVICRHGVPEELVTDQGTNFMGQVMKSVCKILKIKKINTSAYHPQANLVERANRELKTYLRQYVMGDPYVWDNFLPYFSFEYNTTVNSSTGYTPHELLYGHAARLPSSIHKGDLQEANYHSYALEMRNIFKRMHEAARANLVSSKVQRKAKYDQGTNEWSPMLGDKVLVQANPMGVGQKLQNTWRGPYTVIDVPSEASRL
uniref:RNA-directed DNA polymerase n=1 Tax=Anopheles darlingi TaxID=43151 RepID=A0A2M4CWN3_ANODA